MTDAWDDEDRAIARALGIDAPETEAELPGADVDPDAVAEYQAVLAALPFDAVAPRPELEHEMVAAALARRPAAARAIFGGPARARRSASRWIAIGATAAAAAAIAVALAVGLPATGPGSPGARIARAASTAGVERLLADPGTRKGVLHTPSGDTVGRVALSPDGQGFLYALPPPRSSGQGARWLWLDTGSDQVLVGRLPEAATVHFVVRGDVDAVEAVFVTTERGTPRAPGPLTSRATFTAVS